MPHVSTGARCPHLRSCRSRSSCLHSIGDVQKVALIAFFCLFPILLNTMDGVRAIDPTLIDTARSSNVPRWGADSASSCRGDADRRGHAHQPPLAVIIMVVAELLRARTGVYVLLISKNTFEFAPRWAAISSSGSSATASRGLHADRAPRAQFTPGRAGAPSSRRRSDARDRFAREDLRIRRQRHRGDPKYLVHRFEKEFVCVVGPPGAARRRSWRGWPARTDVLAAFLKGKPVTSSPEEMALVFQEYSRSLMPRASCATTSSSRSDTSR